MQFIMQNIMCIFMFSVDLSAKLALLIIRKNLEATNT